MKLDAAFVLTQAERRLFRWWSIWREIFGERSTILWRIYRIQFTDCSDFVHRSERPQDVWKKPSLFLHFKLADTKQQPAVILRLFFNKPGAIGLRNISAFLLLDLTGNCLRKRENTERQRMPKLFSPDFLHQLSSLLPFPLHRSQGQEIWAKRHRTRRRKKKKKTSESS